MNPRPTSSATRRRPVSSPANRDTEIENRFQRSSRPTTALVHGSRRRDFYDRQNPLSQLSYVPKTAMFAEDSTFSLPVLLSEQASTVTLLQDDPELQTEPLPPPSAAILGQSNVQDNPPEYGETLRVYLTMA